MFKPIFDFLKSVNDMGLITLLVGGVAIYLYIRQRKDSKRDAAKIILQEIRRAEDIISEYKDHRKYKFTKKIIATNSWAKNIHHFVGDLNIDELDKISDLYSTGEYLDSIVSKVSDFSFDINTAGLKKVVSRINTQTQPIPITSSVPLASGGQIQSGSQPVTPIPTPVNMHFELPAPWGPLLD